MGRLAAALILSLCLASCIPNLVCPRAWATGTAPAEPTARRLPSRAREEFLPLFKTARLAELRPFFMFWRPEAGGRSGRPSAGHRSRQRRAPPRCGNPVPVAADASLQDVAHPEPPASSASLNYPKKPPRQRAAADLTFCATCRHASTLNAVRCEAMLGRSIRFSSCSGVLLWPNWSSPVKLLCHKADSTVANCRTTTRPLDRR